MGRGRGRSAVVSSRMAARRRSSQVFLRSARRAPPEAFVADAFAHRTGDSGAVAAVGRLASGINCLGLGECLMIPLEANSSAWRRLVELLTKMRSIG